MKILKPEEIRQPKGALIVEKPKDEDWEAKLGGEEPDINESGDYTDDITEYELQRNQKFDTFSCVTFSLINKVQCIIKHKYGQITDWSKRYVAIGSGTKYGQGNGVNSPCEFLRKKGTVLESDYPTLTPDMSINEYFKAIPKEISAKECFLKNWAYTHKYTPRYDGYCSTLNTLNWAIKKSPIMVSVEGYYSFKNGKIIWKDRPIAHEVLIVNISGDTIYVLDSENPGGLLPFDINYRFHYPKIGFVQKKNLEVSIKNMAIEQATLIRSNETGKIYLLDSEGIKHWIINEDTFVAVFGDKIWNDRDWNDIPEDECKMIKEGIRITTPLNPALDALVRSFIDNVKKLGRKLSGK